jgi:DNA-directed RNA polymerase specialized sigma24 family protein
MNALGFSTTHWSRVLRAQSDNPKHARQALGELCANYRHPLEAFLRCSGMSATDAEEFAQQFFAVDLVEHGDLRWVRKEDRRFRSWLLRALKDRVYKERRRAMAQQRGGGVEHVAVSPGDDGVLAEASAAVVPADRLYDREFAKAVIQRAIDRVEVAYRLRGKAKTFEALKDRLPGVRETRSYGSTAEELGLSPEAVRKAAEYLKSRVAAAVRTEVRSLLEVGEDVEDEIRQLQAALSGGA